MTSSDPILQEAAEVAALALDEARSSLMMAVRFLDVALWRMPLASKPLGLPTATDGYLFYLDPLRVIERYRAGRNEVVRDCLHAVLHCVFRHPFDGSHPDVALWDLACDLSVEACALELAALRFPCAGDDRRQKALATIRTACPQLTADHIYRMLAQQKGADDDDASDGAWRRSKDPESASPAAQAGLGKRFLADLPELFARDDHAVWTRTPEVPAAQVKFDDDVSIIASTDEKLHGTRQDELQEDENGAKPGVNMPGAPAPSTGGAAAEGEVEGGDRFMSADALEAGSESLDTVAGVKVSDFEAMTWTDIGKLVQIDLEAFTGKPGVEAGTFEVALSIANRKTYDFREFLKRFSALSEEMKVSTDEFDYVYYTYGLSRYGNMPLVEPLEYQESRRIREFVIAIDTSASCAGGLVRHFVEKTYDVLRSSAAFGRTVNVHVVQCDCDVRKDTKITNMRDLDHDFGEFTARGFGGTDFRPVFAYVNDLVASRELTNLKGMIYLTDGIGTYPEEPPDYECVFVFVNDDGIERKVPPWAMKVMMTEDEIVEL